MNRVLLISNAITLTILLGGHFFADHIDTQVAQRMPHYLQLQESPQLAVMSDQRGFVGQDVSQENVVLPAPSAERLVF
ncbi:MULTISPECIES: hypothetical protein [unclassified Pseudomonas]|jgi:hypothetical protein|uniref:hypothetical protein n=1 Tax=unclassified Pseudomonas TaxID=196821 RepID=UPI00069E3B78|nr:MULTISPECIES: hypothetical protein [unclassified Pseudomonas]WPN48344.1 hypothetical protein QMK58_06675 [Pseudomonas sp. P8_241]